MGSGFISIPLDQSKAALTRVGSRERGQQRALLSGSVVDLHHVVQRCLEQDELAEKDWRFKVARAGEGLEGGRREDELITLDSLRVIVIPCCCLHRPSSDRINL